MKTITINLYEFHELSEASQKIAFEKLRSTIFMDFESIVLDAANINFIIEDLDVEHNYVLGYFYQGEYDTASKIVKEHGQKTETYKIANDYLSALESIIRQKNMLGFETSQALENEHEALDEKFLSQLSNVYLNIIKKYCDWETSKEDFKQIISCHDYFFTEDGKISSLK